MACLPSIYHSMSPLSSFPAHRCATTRYLPLPRRPLSAFSACLHSGPPYSEQYGMKILQYILMVTKDFPLVSPTKGNEHTCKLRGKLSVLHLYCRHGARCAVRFTRRGPVTLNYANRRRLLRQLFRERSSPYNLEWDAPGLPRPGFLPYNSVKVNKTVTMPISCVVYGYGEGLHK